MRSAAPTLRDYQDESVKRLRAAMRRSRRVILQSPTGSGKTVTAAYMVARAQERGLSSNLVVHRRELVKQISEALWSAHVRHGFIAAGRTMTKDDVHVSSVQTLVRRMDRVPTPDLVIVDECHHATATTYRKVLDDWPDAWVIGLTATPSRTDGQGLGDVFDEIVEGPDVGDLIERGYLSPYRVIAPSEPLDVSRVPISRGDFQRKGLEVVVDNKAVIGDAVRHYQKYVAPKTCLVYCVSRAHARHVTEAYREAGIDAHYVAGDTPDGERERAVEWFRRGRIPVIVSVDLFGEGLDCPGLTAVQLLRHTTSLGLHLQQIGRALRIEPGKDCAIILDHVGNTWRHGLPDDEREWSLEGRKITKKKAEELQAPDLRHCPECFAIFRASQVCPSCGHQFEIKGAMPEHEDGELEEIDPEEHRRRRAAERKREEAQARGLRALTELAIERDYKPGWAARRQSFRRDGESASLAELRKMENEIRRELRMQEAS